MEYEARGEEERIQLGLGSVAGKQSALGEEGEGVEDARTSSVRTT